MNFWVGDILSLWWVVKEIIIYVKNKYFSWTNWQNESLKQDIFSYLKEFNDEIKSVDKNLKLDDKWKAILWPAYEMIENFDKLSIEDFDSDKLDKTYLNNSLNEYMKIWGYNNIFHDFEIKIKSYLSVVSECIENYWNNDWKKLRKERKNFDECLKKSLKSLERWYVDFMLFTLTENKRGPEIREILIDQCIDRVNFEKYVPAVQHLFDKIDNRVLVE